MNNIERRDQQILYISDDAVFEEQKKCRIMLQKLNFMDRADFAGISALVKELFGSSDGAFLNPPFYCDYGSHIHVGKNFFANYNCTIIDVDENRRLVEIKNYTDNLQYRAFGINTEPTYADFEEFLESRCFPRSRDKMKLELDKLGIPFYDPMMIIEKTEGRMADDDFWLKIEV